MYSKEFDKKIEDAVAGGKISKSDRTTLHIDASSQNIDDEELDVVIDGKAYLAKHNKKYSGLEDISISNIQAKDSVVETSDDDGFDFTKLLKLIMHSRIALFITIAVLIILLWPVLLFILVPIVSLFPSGSSDSAKSGISDKDTTAIVTKSAENIAEESQKNIAEDNIVIMPEGQRCRIEAIGHTLYATVLGDDGSELQKKEMNFEGNINEFCCTGSTVFVVLNVLENVLEEGEQSKLPFVWLYKVDVHNESWELMEISNYITFDKVAKKIHLKTASGLAGECEADGYLWEEKDLNM